MKNPIKNLCLLFLAALCSCTGQKSGTPVDAGTQTYSYKDSCRHLVLSLSLELPQGTDNASLQISDSLIADFIQNARRPGYDAEDTLGIAPYTDGWENPQAIVDHYGKASYAYLLRQAKADYEARMQYLEEDSSITAEERELFTEYAPQWSFEFNLTRGTDTPDFVVYHSQAYIYRGGAHGGVAGSGDLTFDKHSGQKVSCFITPTSAHALQPLLRKGLLQYYKEAGDEMTDRQLSERLQIEGEQIPLPNNPVCPNATGDSLVFTYGQYEIACYADGMPSFLLAVQDLLPYLTPEGKALLTKEQTTPKST